ncbi:aminoglycoside phosphotransferase family protein [Actinomadura rayongensis]|uniref:Hydroxyurea phosphotransferase n=1 Tax=Actinomadura rayongensis TaxID=1429076 RepID=A0A6I4W7K3_9ACTN|nr:aminoglycoside phosphotransferase family protein [Actinomadura rayongensis]MXQ65451.1 hydroxyurea phosphotransferase [Actinomadura rayongensis]
MIHVPEELNRTQDGKWLATLPDLAATFLERWDLSQDGRSMHGQASLVLPVRRKDGTPAALKFQPADEESRGEAPALRIWDGKGAVRLIEDDPPTGTMLLERLDETRPLSSEPDDDTAVAVIADLMSRLTAIQAPPGMRTLKDIGAAMLDETPEAVANLQHEDERALVKTCAKALAEVIDEPGDRLLHWDLHYDNVLASDREPWLAIDPKPLAGDRGFDLLPALTDRWNKTNPAKTTLRRFDQLTEALDLDRPRATRWTLARVLQNALWDIEDGETKLDRDQILIAETLREHRGGDRS